MLSSENGCDKNLLSPKTRIRGTNGLLVVHYDASEFIFGYNMDKMVS